MPSAERESAIELVETEAKRKKSAAFELRKKCNPII